MSLIHEALEKVEQEKKAPSLSGPTVPLTEGKTPPPKENRGVIYGIIVVLLFCFVVGIVYLVTGTSETTSSEKKILVSDVSPAAQGRYNLTGITRVGTDWNAIVNNELVRVGDGVSGARVVRIEEQEVTLDERGRTFTLELHGRTK